jgi:RNA polymerase sigma-70 factor (ECF subfamily)
MDFSATLSEQVDQSDRNDFIVQTFLNDGETGLETVVNTYSHALLRYCHSILCDYHMAQDVVQITFIKLYNGKNKFGGNGKNQDKDLMNFLYKIAYNTCIDEIRKRKRIADNPVETAAGQKRDYIPENIQAALMSLSTLDRAVTYSHAVDETPFAELAKVYGKSAASLRKRYERARKKLSRLLSNDYPNYINERSSETNEIRLTKGENDNDE